MSDGNSLENLFEQQAADKAAAEQRRHTANRGSSTIADWAASTPWDNILAADWTPAGRDRCGCSTWTAPGPHDSPKSATAHESGCDLARDDGRLHVWTDDPPAYLRGSGRGLRSKSYTKLDLVALRDYAGDYGQACEDLGIDWSEDVQQRLSEDADDADDLMDAHSGPSSSSDTVDDQAPRDGESVADYVHRVAREAIDALYEADDLRVVRQRADLGGMSMLTLLPCVLAHITACIPWDRTLPGGPVLVRTPASFNTATVLVGPSGSGKSSDIEATPHMLDIRHTVKDLDDPLSSPPGRYRITGTKSGQGIGGTVARVPRKTDEDDDVDDTGGTPLVWRDSHRSALIVHDEWMKTYGSSQQTASTMAAELRTSVTGGMLGGVALTHEYNLQLPSLSYRHAHLLTAQTGSTPGLADTMAAAQGTTQRFLFAPAGGPSSGLSRDEIRARARRRRRERMAQVASSDTAELPCIVVPTVTGSGPVDVVDDVADEIVEDYELRQEGLLDTDGGHDTRMRAAAAAALAVLIAGARGATSTDIVLDETAWALAGHLMAIHEATRRHTVWAQGSIERAEEKRKADARSERRVVDDARSAVKVASALENRAQKKSAEYREDKLRKARAAGSNGVTTADWRKGAGSGPSKTINDGVDQDLIDEGLVVMRRVSRSLRWFLIEHDPQSTLPDSDES